MSKLVTVVIGNKAYQMTKKMAKGIIEMAKQKYKTENVNAIVAVEKDGIISMQKDVYNSTDEMLEAVVKWTNGKYNTYYVTKKG